MKLEDRMFVGVKYLNSLGRHLRFSWFRVPLMRFYLIVEVFYCCLSHAPHGRL